jgi:hypothetical protein
MVQITDFKSIFQKLQNLDEAERLIYLADLQIDIDKMPEMEKTIFLDSIFGGIKQETQEVLIKVRDLQAKP